MMGGRNVSQVTIPTTYGRRGEELGWFLAHSAGASLPNDGVVRLQGSRDGERID